MTQMKGWRTMINHEELAEEIDRRVRLFLNEQKSNGSWRYCFEGPVMTDAYMMITLRTLEIDHEDLIQKLTRRLISLQEDNGTWRVYPNETSGNLTGTVEATVALLYSGYVDPNDPQLKKAISYIRAHGGIKKTGFLTRTFFAMNGLYPWPRLPFNPAYLVLLPGNSPLSFYSFSSYARAHFAPGLAAFEHRYSLKSRYTPDISSLASNTRSNDSYWPEIDQLFSDDRSHFFTLIKNELYKWMQIPSYWLQRADRWLESYITTRIENDGTLLSYASSTYVMIYGLMALGYDQKSPIIQQAIQGLESLIWEDEQIFHVQNSPSEVWDTGLMSLTLHEAGVPKDHPSLLKAADYLLKKQQHKKGDWIVHNPGVTPGGWGFSDSDTIHPDLDDTQTALRSMIHYAEESEIYSRAFRRGFHWMETMQNKDGGWAAFEKDTDQYLIALLPIKNLKSAAIDPSTPDITGRVLNCLTSIGGATSDYSSTKRAVRWLEQRQEKDGSWYSRWGVCYIYGTWAALTGLIPSKQSIASDPIIKKAVKWLESIQNEDGGWGESCSSDTVFHYTPLGKSTAVQTAWATDALITYYNHPSETIDRGISFLINHHDLTREANYPTGAGLPGKFYVRYHGYPRYWPLLALSHYKNKYLG